MKRTTTLVVLLGPLKTVRTGNEIRERYCWTVGANFVRSTQPNRLPSGVQLPIK